ncbi:CPBP family intramembrane glutamic endopeptidase [Bowmanella dokdonensis]|uniref:CPBP family intramembrane metalloprotease n=1 Tax=Bowmanella dokdonensis TaxID=751969 RepID=A0A939DPT6_9ALTE|nr:CPBP family intramembrane glutamic endopeptidase [Bowmanella dokdonensis]MBN7826524.1 CPBP family intramembrane metalloprotease [Bowmanella dokdonensis]
MTEARHGLTTLKGWDDSHPLLAFPMVYLGWAYLFWAPMLWSQTSVWSLPNLLWFLIGGASPLLAGLGLAALTGGKTQVLDLVRRLLDWRRIPGRWWLTILLFWLCFDLIMAGLAVVLGITDSPLDVHWTLLQNPGPLLFLLLLSFVFPAIEEIGLRGVYLDRLQQHFGPATAGLINGAVWAAWHAPFVCFPGYYADISFNPELYWWLPMILCQTLLLVQVYNQTNRSILAVLIFHGMMNFTGEWLRISSDMYPFMLSGNVLAAALLLIWWNNKKV